MAAPSLKPFDRVFGAGRRHRAFRTAIFAVILLPTAIIMAVSFVLLADALMAREGARRQTIVERDRLFAHSIAHGISVHLEASKDAVSVAAAEAARRPMTREAMRDLLTDMVDQSRTFFAASVADAAGTAVLVYDPKGATEEERYQWGFDLSERDYFKELRATKQPVVSEALTSLVSPQPTVAVAAPILDAQGDVAGFIAAGVSLDPLYDMALAELGSETVVPVVFDKKGQVVVHPDRTRIEVHENLAQFEPAARALRGEEGFIDAFTDVDGREQSAAYAPVPGLGWGVWVAQEPPADARLFVRQELRRTSVFYTVILFLNLVLALVVWSLIRALFAAREQERAFLTSIGDGVIAIDRAWNIMLWNPAAEVLTGWSRQEAVGRPFREKVRFLRERDRKENVGFIEETFLFGTTQQMSNSTILVARDGKEIPVSDSAAPILDADGKVSGVIIVFRDATSERDTHILRTDFAYASHQMRTPITKALWGLEAAAEGARKDVKEKIEVARRALRDVQKLSEDLLEVSQIDQRTVLAKPQATSAAKAIGDAVEACADEAKMRRVHVKARGVPETSVVETDARLLSRALEEIISNAIHYSPPGGTVEVLSSVGAGELLIEVRDQGIGISEEQQALVFTKFFRGQNVPEEASGSGLGLFIAREYVRLLHGRIWFVSEIGHGTTFYVAVPAEKPRA